MSGSKRATDAALDALHALMASAQAEELTRALERARLPKRIPDPEDLTGRKTIPNPEYAELSPKLLGVIRAFLKDNGIDAPTTSERFSPLVEQLRNLDVGEEAYN